MGAWYFFDCHNTYVIDYLLRSSKQFDIYHKSLSWRHEPYNSLLYFYSRIASHNTVDFVFWNTGSFYSKACKQAVAIFNCLS